MPRILPTHRTREIGAIAAVLVLCCSLLGYSAGHAADASAGTLSGVGSISGTVVDSSSAPMAGVTVTATGDAGTGTATTDSTGAYSITGLADGTYKVEFAAADGTHASQYYSDKSAASVADGVNVSGGSAVSGIDATLYTGATISGTVLSPDSTPQVSAVVTATAADGGSFGVYTDASGNYQITNLPPSTYTVEFQPSDGTSLNQWWENADSSSSATSIDVTEGQVVSGVDATLAPGGSISGFVYAPGLVPIQGVSVSAEAGGNTYVATTQANGGYSFGGLSTGDYRLQFVPPDNDYLAQYWNGKSSYDSADLIHVVAGSPVTDVSPILQPAGSISGTVTDGSNNPIDGATVYASGVGGGYGSALTDANGNYTITQLPVDNYTVNFSASSGYLSQYYNGTSDYSSATSLQLNGGDHLTSIDASLNLGGVIEGTITDTGGHPLEGIEVDAYGNNSGYGSATTDASGHYQVIGLATDEYEVSVYDPNQVYAPTYYGGAIEEGDATPVSIVAGTTVSNIDASLAVGATVSGTITDTHAQPVPNAQISLIRTASGNVISSGESDSNGNFTVPAMPAGTYKVFVQPSDPNLLSRYWTNAATVDEASPLTLIAGQLASGVDVALPDAPASISGTVESDGLPVANVCAVLWSGSSQLRSSCTDYSGSYRMDDVAPGSYTVSFQDQMGILPTTWNGGAVTQGTSTPVNVAADQHVTASINISQFDHSISGAVSHQYGDPSSTTCVYLYHPGPTGSFAGFSTCTGVNGTYLLSGVPSGDYVLAFVDPMGLKPTAWYSTASSHGVATQGAATTLTLGDTTTSLPNMNIGFDPAPGSIIGQISNSSSTSGLANICLYAYAWNSQTNTLAANASAATCTNAQGGYVLSGLPLTGTPRYQVAMVDPTGAYPTRWADVTSGPSSMPLATTSSTRPTADSPFKMGVYQYGIANLSVTEGGSISGTVLNHSTGLPRVGACVYVDFAADGAYAGVGAVTDSSGHYTLPNLADGQGTQGYKVGFYADCTPGQPPTDVWNGGATSEAGASPVDVYTGQNTGSIDASF